MPEQAPGVPTALLPHIASAGAGASSGPGGPGETASGEAATSCCELRGFRMQLEASLRGGARRRVTGQAADDGTAAGATAAARLQLETVPAAVPPRSPRGAEECGPARTAAGDQTRAELDALAWLRALGEQGEPAPCEVAVADEARAQGAAEQGALRAPGRGPPASQPPTQRFAYELLQAIRLRGLPYSATAQDVRALLVQHGLGDRISGSERAVYRLLQADGRASGQAVVYLRSRLDADFARGVLHRMAMGSGTLRLFGTTNGTSSTATLA